MGIYKKMSDPDDDEYPDNLYEFNLTEYMFDMYDIDDVAGDRATLDGVCHHEWKEYEGLTQKYNYCIKCDQKDK